MRNSIASTITPPRELTAVECVQYLAKTSAEITKLADAANANSAELQKLNSNQLATLRYTQRAMARLLGQVRIALR